jgi:hypothetical protein
MRDRVRLRREAEAPRSGAPAPAAPLITRLQQSAGNHAVAALLAREPLDYVAAPHEGGDASQLAGILGDRAGEQLALADVPEPPGAPPPAPAQADPVDEWLARKVATNAEYAKWISDGVTHGFVVWTGRDSEAQLKKLGDNQKVGSTDPAQAEILGGLKTIRALVLGKAVKWTADRSKPKETVGVGSFIRGQSPHDGRAIDVNGLDWTGAKGPAQVEEALRALPAGSYGIGLPFQGQFFPRDEWLDERKKADPPADITSPSLVKWVGTRYTSTYKDGRWEDRKAGGQAVDRLKSATLKAAIAELNGKGYSIYVFPDNDNHIHIQNP